MVAYKRCLPAVGSVSMPERRSPAALPGPARSFVTEGSRLVVIPSRAAPFTLSLCALVLSAGLLSADTGANHQASQLRPIQLGSSGGNINDRSKAWCCSGTLGALVTKDGIQYVLSNNHVLARTNEGAVGDAIVQPGLIDEAPTCAQDTGDAVAHLSEWVPMSFRKGTSNTIDAAIAEVQAGQVAGDGAILDVGVVSATPAWSRPSPSPST